MHQMRAQFWTLRNYIIEDKIRLDSKVQVLYNGNNEF